MHLSIKKQKQKGATLLVALILLLIMTIVGIGASQVSKMQYQMARNTQFELDMYQLALSESNAQANVLNDDNTFVDNNTDNQSVVPMADAALKLETKVGTKVDLKSDFQILGSGDAPNGFSLDGKRVMQTIVFKFDTESKIKSSTIRSNQTQGLSMLSPGTPIL